MTTGQVNLFPDPYFTWLQSRSLKYFTHTLVRQSGTNGTWDSAYKQPYGPGAWKYTAATGDTFGLSTWFSNPDSALYNIVPGDVISVGMYLNIPSGKKVRVLARFFNTNDDDLFAVAGSVDITGDGSDVQTAVVENLTVPTNGHGILLYTFFVDSTDYHILAGWVVAGPTAGSAPPLGMFPDIITGRVVGLQTVSYPLGQLLLRTPDAVGTVAATTDTTPVRYYMKRASSAAVWTQPTQLDL